MVLKGFKIRYFGLNDRFKFLNITHNSLENQTDTFIYTMSLNSDILDWNNQVLKEI